MEYIKNELHFGLEKKSLQELCANYVRPIYVYDLKHIASRFQKLSAALKGVQLYYAMKANSNRAVLETLRKAGAGADVVSLGEIKRALECGFKPEQMVYSGVGKTRHEISEALKLGIYQINIESLPELQRIVQIAQELKVQAQVALRLNPDVDIKTHPYIATGLKDNKFGMELSLIPQLKQILSTHRENVSLCGVSLHLGSQMLEFEGYREALTKLKKIYLDLQKDFPELKRFDIGGGLGVIYDRDDVATEEKLLQEYAKVTFDVLGDLPGQLQSEPGRWLLAHSGVLLTQVQYVKQTSAKTFVIVDTGMNHLIRPALYQATHRILPLQKRSTLKKYDVVGPICESADVFAKNTEMTEVQEGDFLAIIDTGAYGYSMANIYNLQELPAEIALG